jgi:hypothetical protein
VWRVGNGDTIFGMQEWMHILRVYVLWSGEPQFIFYSLKKLVIHAYSYIISNSNYALK